MKPDAFARRMGWDFPTPIVLWRLVWLVPVYVVFVILCAVVFVGFGSRAARGVWEDMI